MFLRRTYSPRIFLPSAVMFTEESAGGPGDVAAPAAVVGVAELAAGDAGPAASAGVTWEGWSALSVGVSVFGNLVW